MEDKATATTFIEFCDAARDALQEESDRLLDMTLPRLKTEECRWHPNGFAVFHIDDHHKLGQLRLHIWPNSPRVLRPDAPPIHSHVWHLCSQVLVGTYSETLFEEIQGPGLEVQEYQSADIDYLVDRNSFGPTKTSLIRPTSTVTVSAGQLHVVEAGIPHETQIQSEAFVATLMIASHPRMQKATVYSDSQIASNSYDRPLVPQEEKLTMLNTLNQELARSVV
ncbi:hypothetical protein [Arthrobacter sp. QXT-31]|uniref:hypothetical protein n=1 Tax=Arthrobacter sp. QXT-31 TaxID=1357915 RepID=UPI0012F95945|nr:hypothetical protein [Arthrobacter sp. QXT-31]